MNFNELTAEVIEMTLEYLSPNQLANVQLVCKRLRVLAERFLYRNLSFTLSPIDGASTSLIALGNTLWTGPGLMQHVRTITIDISKGYSISKWPTRPLVLDMIMKLCTRLESLEVHSSVAAYLGAKGILSPKYKALTNLKRLDLATDSIQEDYTRSMIFTNLIATLPRLVYLRVQPLDHEDYELVYGENLTLTEIHLARARISGQTFGHIISSVPNLKVLTYEISKHLNIGGEQNEDRPSRFIDCGELTEGLRGGKKDDEVQKRGLLIESLTISIDFVIVTLPVLLTWRVGDFHDERSEWGIMGSIGSLKEFTHLRTLEIPLVILFGWNQKPRSLKNVLPRCLETLRLRLDGSTFRGWRWTEGQECITEVLDKYVEDEPDSSLRRIVILMNCTEFEYNFGGVKWFSPHKSSKWNLDLEFRVY